MNGRKLETVTSFKYLDSVITDEGSKPEIFSRIAQTTAALTRLKAVWNDRSISLSVCVLSLVTSIFLYTCESWTLKAELQRRIQAIKIRWYRKILHISYKDQRSLSTVLLKLLCRRRSTHLAESSDVEIRGICLNWRSGMS